MYAWSSTTLPPRCASARVTCASTHTHQRQQHTAATHHPYTFFCTRARVAKYSASRAATRSRSAASCSGVEPHATVARHAQHNGDVTVCRGTTWHGHGTKQLRNRSHSSHSSSSSSSNRNSSDSYALQWSRVTIPSTAPSNSFTRRGLGCSTGDGPTTLDSRRAGAITARRAAASTQPSAATDEQRACASLCARVCP